jgi:hypothetical protein
MKAGSKNNYYDVPSLCNEAYERNFRGDPNSVGNLISPKTYQNCWMHFVKWCKGQIESGRAVSVPGFGIVGFD